MKTRPVTYNDERLKINAANSRSCRIDEILRLAAEAGDETHTRRHFEQFWQYDQLAFEGTNAH